MTRDEQENKQNGDNPFCRTSMKKFLDWEQRKWAIKRREDSINEVDHEMFIHQDLDENNRWMYWDVTINVKSNTGINQIGGRQIKLKEGSITYQLNLYWYRIKNLNVRGWDESYHEARDQHNINCMQEEEESRTWI